MNKTWVVALAFGLSPWAQALQPAPLSSVAAVEEGQFLPGEFVVTFRPEAKAEPRSANGVVVTGNAQVDRLNARFGVYAAIPGAQEGTYRFKVPATADVREIVRAYRELAEPVQSASGVLAGSRDVRETADAALVQPKQRLVGVMLAAGTGVSNPAALFEGQVASNGLAQPAVFQQEGDVNSGDLLHRVGCNPRTDGNCGQSAPAPAPRADCDPRFDDNCSNSAPSRPQQPTRPTPPQRRPGEVTCDPGIDCPGDHPDNRPPEPIRPPSGWTQRPTYPPSSWSQPSGSVEFLRSVPVGVWHPVGSVWFPVTRDTAFGSFGNDSTAVRRGGQDTGIGQQSSYQRTLTAKAYADRYQLYWGWVGHGCSDYTVDGRLMTYCPYWQYEYRWIWANQVYTERTATIDVNFVDDQNHKLLPWESESFTFYFNGQTQQVSSSQDGSAGWSYAYTIQGPSFGTGHAVFTVQPGPKRQTAADSNAVSAGLEMRNGKAWLVVHDKRATFYKGEPLDVAIKVIRQVSCGHWWCSDTRTTVFESRTDDQPFPKLRIAIPADVKDPVFAGPELTIQPSGCDARFDDTCKPSKIVGQLVDQGPGKYYIETSWGNGGQFRRASSAVSTPEWHSFSIENGRTEVGRP